MGAAARPVRTKRPNRRAVEAAGGQIPAAPSTKRPGRSANAARQAQALAVVGIAEAAARSASRSCPAKRRRNPSSHTLTLDPCSNRGGKRVGSKLLQQELPGAKRPRSTDVPSEASPLVYRNHHDCDSHPICHPRRRDWANLADGPAGLIAERILAYDVADYVRYRAVCRPWRQSSTEPRSHSGLDRRFHPWRWTMLREERAVPVPGQRCCFLNTSTGECVKVDIPELHDHKLLALTPEGLLVLAHDRKYIRLLNPLTRHLTELPPLTTLVPPRDHHSLLLSPYFSTYFAAWGSGISNDDSTFVLCFNKLRMLGLAKPGEDRWMVRRYRRDGIMTAPVMIAGRFYCVTRDAVMFLGTGPDRPLVEAAKLKNIHVSLMADSLHLVNNCGELMLVHRHLGPLTAWNKSGWRYDIYRFDADTRTLLPVKSLGGAGRALFMGMRCSLSVSLDVFPSGSISADTIYLSFDFTERDMLKVGGYHLADGSVELPCSLLARPYTLVDYLSLSNTVKNL